MSYKKPLREFWLSFHSRSYFLHILTWIIVAAAVRYYSVPELTKDNLEVIQHASIAILSQSIFVFYFLGYVIFPRFLYKKSFLFFILSLAVLFQLIHGLNYFEFRYLSEISSGTDGNNELYVRRAWKEYFHIHPFWACFTNFSLAYITYAWSLFYVTPVLAIKVMRDVISSRNLNLRQERDRLALEKSNLDLQRQSLQLQRDNLYLELNFLKSQINPHFLFNTLNSIYVSTSKADESAAELVLRLSQLMRYSLYESNRPWVRLEEEAEYIENYVALEMVRFSSRVNILFYHNISGESFLIAPLILISLLENAFKHGVRDDINKPFVHIQINLTGSELFFSVKNSQPNDPSKSRPSDPGTSSGLGISNTAKRLMLLYPQQHKLDFQEGKGYFYVELRLLLSKDYSASTEQKIIQH